MEKEHQVSCCVCRKELYSVVAFNEKSIIMALCPKCLEMYDIELKLKGNWDEPIIFSGGL